jgi:hypothetical protein
VLPILLLILLLFSIECPNNGDRGGEGSFPATPFLQKSRRERNKNVSRHKYLKAKRKAYGDLLR